MKIKVEAPTERKYSAWLDRGAALGLRATASHESRVRRIRCVSCSQRVVLKSHQECLNGNSPRLGASVHTSPGRISYHIFTVFHEGVGVGQPSNLQHLLVSGRRCAVADVLRVGRGNTMVLLPLPLGPTSAVAAVAVDPRARAAVQVVVRDLESAVEETARASTGPSISAPSRWCRNPHKNDATKPVAGRIARVCMSHYVEVSD